MCAHKEMNKTKWLSIQSLSNKSVMMSSVTDRPYCGKSIYRRCRVFLSLALCVLLSNFVTHNTKPCFMTFHDISSETLSECSVDVFLLFPQDCKQHSHSSEARLAAGISFCAAVRGGTAAELHVSVDTMKWLIDYTGAGLIKIHRGGRDTQWQAWEQIAHPHLQDAT